jgi:hypothetical protein
MALGATEGVVGAGSHRLGDAIDGIESVIEINIHATDLDPMIDAESTTAVLTSKVLRPNMKAHCLPCRNPQK